MSYRTERAAIHRLLQPQVAALLHVTCRFTPDELVLTTVFTEPGKGFNGVEAMQPAVVTTESHNGRVWQQRLQGTYDGQEHDTNPQLNWHEGGFGTDWPEGRGWAERVANGMLKAHLTAAKTAVQDVQDAVQAARDIRAATDAAFERAKVVLPELAGAEPNIRVDDSAPWLHQINVALSPGHSTIWVEVRPYMDGPGHLLVNLHHNSKSNLPLDRFEEMTEITRLFHVLKARLQGTEPPPAAAKLKGVLDARVEFCRGRLERFEASLQSLLKSPSGTQSWKGALDGALRDRDLAAAVLSELIAILHLDATEDK